VFRFVTQLSLVAEDISPGLRAAVAGRDVLSSFPVTCSPSYKEDLLQFLLHLGAASVGLVSDCVLASFAYGMTSDPCVVMSVGVSNTVCAGLEKGSVEYFVSRALNLQSLLENEEEPVTASDIPAISTLQKQFRFLDVENDDRLNSKVFGPREKNDSKNTSSCSAFHSLLQRMPKNFRGCPVLLCGEGTALGGFVAAFRRHAKQIGFTDAKGLPEPWNAVMYGASLVSSLPHAELRRLLVRHADVVEFGGPFVVHMRSP
jgi:hypothetical protein